MSIVIDGFLSRFLDLLGVTITSASGSYIAFICGAFIFAIIVISFLVLLFRFLVFLRKG